MQDSGGEIFADAEDDYTDVEPEHEGCWFTLYGNLVYEPNGWSYQ